MSKINFKETSVESYKELLLNGTIKSIDELIFNLIKSEGKPISRTQLKQISGLEHNLITHAVWSLLKKKLIIECDIKSPCPVTGRNVFLVKPVTGQMKLI